MYRFGPSAYAGALGSPISWLQLGALAGGMYAAYRVFTTSGIVGVPIAVCVVLATCAVSLMPVRGREVIEWAPILALAALRRVLGRTRRVSTSPLEGFRGSSDDPAGPGMGPDVEVPPSLKGIEIIEHVLGRERVGIIKDRHARTYAAVLKVRVASFGLLSSSDQQRRVDAWSTLLTSLCREGTPISRVQWLERTIPSDPDELVRYHLSMRDPQLKRDDDVVRSYESLISDATAATQDHELFLVVQVSVRRAKHLIRRLADTIDEGACLLLTQELQTLADALLACDIQPLGVLKARTLAKHIRLAYDPFQRRALDRMGAFDPAQDGVSALNAWPLAERYAWDHYQTDHAVHATYWVSEWPRREVPVAFLFPLLLQANMQRTISVVMEPIQTSKALQGVEAAIIGNHSSEQMRQAKGFSQTARRAKRSHDLLQRESELAAGYGEFRYSGYVTVSAPTRDELERLCAEMENRALQSRLSVRRLNGLHDVAFRNTLPLAHGLRGAQGAR